MGVHVLLKNLSAEDRKKVYEQIDEAALKLGYALVNVPSLYIIKVGTYEECQQVLDFYHKQDAQCGCDAGSHAKIVDVSTLNKTKVRTSLLDTMRYRLIYERTQQSANN
jgi:hypothetical protein